MMDVLLLRSNMIHLRNISGFCLQSASRSYANAYRRPTSRSSSAYVYNGCLAWYNVVLTPWIHSTVKYSQLEQSANICDISNQPTRTLYEKKIALTTNKKYNVILTYICISQLTVFHAWVISGINKTSYQATHPL